MGGSPGKYSRAQSAAKNPSPESHVERADAKTEFFLHKWNMTARLSNIDLKQKPMTDPWCWYINAYMTGVY